MDQGPAVARLTICIDPGLDYFLKRKKYCSPLVYNLTRRASIKDIIEAHSLPHTEVGRIRLNGKPVGFDHVPMPGDHVEVDAVDPPFNVQHPSLLRPHPLDKIHFIADANVIRLGRLLRLAGFDTVYARSDTDGGIAQMATSQGRIVLTRDIGLLKRKIIEFAKYIRSDRPYDQLEEVIHFFGIESQLNLLSRCAHCNSRIEPVLKQKIEHLLELKTKRYYQSFFRCTGCGQVYWKGSHFERVQERFCLLGGGKG